MTERARSAAEVFALTISIGQHLVREGDRVLEHLDLTTPQWLLLAVLVRGFGGGPARIGEVAALHGTSRQNVRRLAGQLEASGYLELRPDLTDGRATLLCLTDRRSVLDTPRELARQREFLGRALGGIGDEDLAVLEQLLRRWHDDLAAGHGESVHGEASAQAEDRA